jgi:hypothetical protein
MSDEAHDHVVGRNVPNDAPQAGRECRRELTANGRASTAVADPPNVPVEPKFGSTEEEDDSESGATGIRSRLEIQKLHAEIDELSARTRASHGAYAALKAVAPYLVFFGTVLVALLNYRQEVDKYLDQRDREQQLQLWEQNYKTHQLIANWLDSLATAASSSAERDVILQLASLGEPAAPYLIAHLDDEHERDVREVIVAALGSIAAQADQADKIVVDLSKATEKVIKRESAAWTRRSADNVLSHLRALRQVSLSLANASDVEDQINEYMMLLPPWFKNQYQDLLRN